MLLSLMGRAIAAAFRSMVAFVHLSPPAPAAYASERCAPIAGQIGPCEARVAYLRLGMR